MSLIANNLPAFDTDIQDFGAQLLELRRHFEETVQHMNDLNSMWEGEAHNEFMNTFEIDRGKTEEAMNMLQRILEDLRYAHAEYTTCENTVSGIIDSI